ncbi:MAG TPA: hypothetical protein VE398_08570 [Acidobacteriota bacterium]|nr:hypothetical protein [Acidobacteriota bacterium]
MSGAKTIPENHPVKKLFQTLTERGSLQAQLRDQDILQYLGNLLVDFMFIENMHLVHDAGGRRVDHLVDMLKQAVETEMPAKKQYYKHIGDYSLFVLGLFPESLERSRRTSSKNFYSAAGRIGYQTAGDLESSRWRITIFRKLTDEFERCVLSLNWVKEYTTDRYYQFMLRQFDIT